MGCGRGQHLVRLAHRRRRRAGHGVDPGLGEPCHGLDRRTCANGNDSQRHGLFAGSGWSGQFFAPLCSTRWRTGTSSQRRRHPHYPGHGPAPILHPSPVRLPCPAPRQHSRPRSILPGYPRSVVPAPVPSGGLPVGLQLIGAIDAEDLLLDLAEQFERASPWQQIAPMAAATIVEQRRRLHVAAERQVPVLRTGNCDMSNACIHAGPPCAIQHAAAT